MIAAQGESIASPTGEGATTYVVIRAGCASAAAATSITAAANALWETNLMPPPLLEATACRTTTLDIIYKVAMPSQNGYGGDRCLVEAPHVMRSGLFVAQTCGILCISYTCVPGHNGSNSLALNNDFLVTTKLLEPLWPVTRIEFQIISGMSEQPLKCFATTKLIA